MGDIHTGTFFVHLKSVTGSLINPDTTITLEDYITEVNHLIEPTSPVSYIVTPVMVKTEALDPELRDIDRKIFNFPWCTG